ncbi:MAG: 3-deoxy-manno-octulosonate cytidylyltransferase [Synergistaceae bacterium]|jgi:3-deoxy-manno-octulosonate cytidylyltransferase (CMP-KDO synthetase)|nr:3-deoxy-manno-octulosonate cytidylyltransferase [Synergistaceae bacterium]
MTGLDTLAVIPARYGSTRLPGKPLLKLLGKELVLWVWEGARKSASVDRLIVATDCEAIVSLVERAGGEAMMTPSELATGGDRVAFVAERVPSRFVLNVQDDDPMVSPGMIDPMVEALKKDSEINLAVLVKQIEDPAETARNSVVKVVFDAKGRALYFSRSPIPFSHDEGVVRFKHIGPYAWRREALFDFASRPQTPLETAEKLEMLRVLETGGVIRCIKTNIDTVEIDTPEDVELFKKHVRDRKDIAL